MTRPIMIFVAAWLIATYALLAIRDMRDSVIGKAVLETANAQNAMSDCMKARPYRDCSVEISEMSAAMVRLEGIR